MTSSVQSASTNSLPASFPSVDTPPADSGAEPQPSTPFRTEMEHAHAEGRRAEGRRSAGKPKPSEREQERDGEKIDSQATAAVSTTDPKRQVLPLTFALPTVADDPAATKHGDPTGAQPKDDGVDILDLQPKVPDAKPVELPPAALSFAARLSLPLASHVAVDQTKPQPTRADQTKLKPPTPEVGSARQPTAPEKPAPIRAAASTTESESRQSKDSELPRPPPPSAKADFVLPKVEPQQHSEWTVTPKSQISAPTPTVASRLDRVIEPAAAPPSSNNDIRVHVPDNNGGSTEVRFVEAAGEVRVSVRTANAELNQTLRSGLDDLTHKLSNEGVRAEVWHPAIQSTSQSDWSQKSQQDQQGQGSPGSESNREGSGGERESHRNKPQWLEELETSIGNQKN